jgi:hypothetical protein
MIEEDGEKIFFWRRVAPGYSKMRNGFIAKYDFGGNLWSYASNGGNRAKEHWTFFVLP